MRRGNDMPGQEAQFHQPAGIFFWQINVIEDRRLAFAQQGKVPFNRRGLSGSARTLLVDRLLQVKLIMTE
jgi:hypothetical protein